MKRDIYIFGITLILMGYSAFYILPNWSVDPSKRNFVEDTLVGHQVVEKRFHRGGSSRTRRTEKRLVLQMESGAAWQLSGHKEHWQTLTDSVYLGDRFKIYPSAAIPRKLNPGRIEINDVIIYDFDHHHLNGYFILAITLGALIISLERLRHIFRFFSPKDDYV